MFYDFLDVGVFIGDGKAVDGFKVGLVAVVAEVAGAGGFLEFANEGYEVFVLVRA